MTPAQIQTLRNLAAGFQFNSDIDRKLTTAQANGNAGWLTMKPVERLIVGHYHEAKSARRQLAEMAAQQPSKE